MISNKLINELANYFKSKENRTSEEENFLMQLNASCDEFPVTSLTKADLMALGYSTKNISDEDMEEMRDKLSDDYCEQLYWTSLSIIADNLGLKKDIPILIMSIQHLKELIFDNDESPIECYIMLNDGLRSSKTIGFADEVDENGEYKFEVRNEIDDSVQILSAKDLFDGELTNIGYAIENGSLFMYN